MAWITIGFLIRKDGLITPLGSSLEHILGFRTILNKTKIIYGFLPYWNFKYAHQIPFSHLTHLALFGIAFDAQGNIQTRELDYAEPGWRNLDTKADQIIADAHQQGVKVILVLRVFENDVIDAITSSTVASTNVIQQTLDIINSKKYDGVNIDFEYVGEPTVESKTNFTKFVSNFTKSIKNHNPNLHVSIDVYADSVNNDRIWDLYQIGRQVDHIFIMAYDFFRPSSTTAGPVAPLYGAPDKWRQDITTLMAQHTQINSPDKLILGVPFYGYEWRTRSQEHLSPTYPRTGGIATYKRVQELLVDPQISATQMWDDQSMSPWLHYTQNQNIKQIYYEDTRSLGLKYDLVNQSGLAGMGIWALGYEGEAPEMWELIKEKFIVE